MKLTDELQQAVSAAQRVRVTADTARRVLALLDLTSLNDDDTKESAKALCARALTPAGPVAAVCVWPRFVRAACTALKGTPVKVATVVNFPAGGGTAAAVAEEARAAIADGADEIDVVFPYRAFIDGERTRPMNLLRACREACGEGVVMKVILESGAFPDPDLLSWAARDAIAAGADYLKTSTGKIRPAATPEAAALILEAIGQTPRTVGFKASGGIRDTAAAAAYLHLADSLRGPKWATPATVRFGASGLLDALLADLGHRPAEAAAVAEKEKGY